MKKLLSLALALVMALSLMPATALAADKAEVNWLPGGMIPMLYIEETEQILAQSGNAWFLLDKAGNIIKPLGALGYFSMGAFSEGLAAVAKQDGKYGYIDASCQMVIPAGFDYAYSFSEGLAAVHFGDWSTGKGGFIDKTGQLVVQPVYDDCYGFSEGLAAVEKNGLWGFIDKTGREVVPPAYNDVGPFSEGLAMVGVGDDTNRKYGFIDKTGKIVLPLEYDSADSFSEGLAWMQKGDTCGYIDKTGKIVIPCNTGGAFGPFSEGIAGVQDENGTYYIDKTGKVLFRTDGFWGVNISTFEYGLATKDRTNDETGMWDRTYINKNGEEIFSEYYNVTWLWGPCGYVCNIDLGDGDEDGKESYGIFVNPYYTTSQPEQPEQPIQPATAEANPTNDKLTVNGVEQNPTVYKIGDSNYFKIRDLAAVLNGTGKQFSVGYDAEKQSVTAAPGQPYELTGTELAGAASSSQTAQASNDAIYVNGQRVEAEVYKIDGSNYFKLRDLGAALGFEVGWTQEQGMFINTEK